MNECADPLLGWSLKDVEDSSSGPATADIYGKLFNHIRTALRAFLTRLSDSQISFQLFCMRFGELFTILECNTFSRIEVSRCLKLDYIHIFSEFECSSVPPRSLMRQTIYLLVYTTLLQ